MDKILNFLTVYGLEPIILALVINVMTGLIKLPVKALAGKMKDGSLVTRFLVFLPVVLGFLLTMLYSVLVNSGLQIDNSFYRLWLSSSSLSLTFYAVFEKLIPSKKSILKNYEVEANKQLIEEIQSLLKLTDTATDRSEVEISEDIQSDTEPMKSEQKVEVEQTRSACENKEYADSKRRFILGGFRSEKIETEEK